MKVPQLEREIYWEIIWNKLWGFDTPHSEMRGGAIFLGTHGRFNPKHKVMTAAAQEGSDGKIMLIHCGDGEFQAQKVMKFQS